MFSAQVAEDILVQSGRCCCLCHKFCGHKIELHHIVAEADGGTDELDNCIALCFDCHAEVRAYDPKHPKGRRFTPSELRRHRDQWISKVAGSTGSPGRDPMYLEPDRRLFREFISRLDPDCRIVSVLGHPNIGYGAIRFDIFHEIDDVLAWAERPDTEFLDSDLEQLRSTFVSLMKAYVTYLGTNTFRLQHDLNLTQVPDEWETDQPERYQRIQTQLSDYQEEFTERYSDLIRTARRKLAI